MLNLWPGALHDCEGISRRGFLQVGALTGLGLSLPGFLASQAAAAKNRHGKASQKANNCILIWSQGGCSHHDTFDPKPEAPVSVKGEFGVINTAVPGVQFTEIVPNMAKELKRFALLRGWNPKNGSHGAMLQATRARIERGIRMVKLASQPATRHRPSTNPGTDTG